MLATHIRQILLKILPYTSLKVYVSDKNLNSAQVTFDSIYIKWSRVKVRVRTAKFVHSLIIKCAFVHVI